MNSNLLKKNAAEKAVHEIKSGMVIGLGSGSTVQYALEAVARKISEGELKNIIGVPTSVNTEKEANRLGIPVVSLNDLYGKVVTNNFVNEKLIDLTIDGADEVDEKLNLIKGGGGAHLREKVIAQASKLLYIIVDETKISKKLGEKWHVPVEVLQFALNMEKKFLEGLGAKVKLRMKDENVFITDEGNFILDANFGVIDKPGELSSILNNRAGIVEHGLFVNLTTKVFCAMNNGDVKEIRI